MIRMMNSVIRQIEDRISIPICIQLLNEVELDIVLSVSIETWEITATGIFVTIY